jgi:hypothetical protein
MASNATTAIGTTTAMATVPPFESPVLDADGRRVAVDVDEVLARVEELARVLLADDVVGGWNVLVEVSVTITTSPPPLLVLRVVTGVVLGVVAGGGVVLVGGVVVGSSEVVDGGSGVVIGVEDVVDATDVEGVDVVMVVRVSVVESKPHKC